MFIVKATYQGELRKFSLAQSSFPSYDVLQTQVARLFSIDHSFYLSDIQFLPDGGTRVVVGPVAHDEAMYNDLVAPFRGQIWPNGLLRFNVVPVDSAPLLHPSLVNNEIMDSQGYINLGALHDAHVRRPIPRQPSTSGDSTALASHRSSMISQESRQSCCSVSEGKEEVKSLMDSFLKDFSTIVSSTFGEVPDRSAQPRSFSPETVTAEHLGSNNVDDTNDVTIPGAFYRPTYVEPIEKPVHRGITCDFCGQRNIRGTRYHCLQCPDFDLCDECVKERGAKSAHQVVVARGTTARSHTFESIEKPRHMKQQRGLCSRGTIATGHAAPAPSAGLGSNLNAPVVHTNVVCDSCDKTVVGTRHKCLDCSDFDLCDTCFSRPERDHPPHQFVDIKTPGRVIVHRVYDPIEVPVAEQTPLAVAPVVHSATCDLCDSRIEGTRHKCLVCPDYDVCSSCFSITPEHHPKHVFVKLTEIQDLSNRDPAAKKKHSARCDECGKSIRGIRYKCMHPECPDYDLCAKCEALPIEVHPSTHPMLKMRDPETVIPTVYRVGGTSLMQSATPQVETNGIAIATEPEPVKADAAVHTESASVFADASVHTEKGFDVNEVGVATIPQEPLLLDASVSAIPSLPSPPAFALRMPEEAEVPVRLSETETAEPEMGMMPDASFISAFVKKFPQLQDEKPVEVINSAFVGDVNVEDGQVFPAGAEFVKTWRIKNAGNVPWPATTVLEFVAGDRLPAFNGAALSYTVGGVNVGDEVDVSAYDLKAPDVEGKYVSYWRLSDGGKPFGTSMWCDINVVASSGPSSLGAKSFTSSLNSSEVIMPEPSPRRNLSLISTSDVDVEEAHSVASAAMSATSSAHSTDYDTSESLFNEFENTSDDELWEASREQQQVAAGVPPAAPTRAAANGVRSPASAGRVDPEYIVLYDETSGDEW